MSVDISQFYSAEKSSEYIFSKTRGLIYFEIEFKTSEGEIVLFDHRENRCIKLDSKGEEVFILYKGARRVKHQDYYEPIFYSSTITDKTTREKLESFFAKRGFILLFSDKIAKPIEEDIEIVCTI